MRLAMNNSLQWLYWNEEYVSCKCVPYMIAW